MKAQTLVPLAAAAAAQLLVVGNIAAAFAFQQKPPVETLVTVPVVAEIEQVECVRQDPVPYEPVTYQVPLDAELQSYTEKMCDLYDVPLELAYAVMQVESGFTPAARSSTGDYGLMQINSINAGWLKDTTTNQTTALADSLIVVQQLPIIKEQLHSIKAQAQESVKEALSLACTEETLKVVKERRAALNRDRKDLDVRRMAVKKQIMQPFEDFDEVYKECVTDVYGPADEALKGKITDVEAGLKADKEKKVKDYFAEMVKASGVEWVTYEDVGVAVTLTASLKSLKAKVKEYVEKVAADVACINGMENAPEIMAEYMRFGFQLHCWQERRMNHSTSLGKRSPILSVSYEHGCTDELRRTEPWHSRSAL